MSPFRSVPMMVALVSALGLPAQTGVSVSISVGIAPPPLPVYVQPPCPADGYLWTPGYWAYGPDGYYWVPGTWVLAPEPGYLWTPCWWGWSDGAYHYYPGYWGPVVGFYGGINYGYGYGGRGYEGGYWNRGHFYYNRTVNNVARIHARNVYSRPVVNRGTGRTSFNGGAGGLRARPTAGEQRAEGARRLPPTSQQAAHVRAAEGNRQLLAKENHGRPVFAATPRPGEFRDAVPSRPSREARPLPSERRPDARPEARPEPRPVPRQERIAPREPRPGERPQPRPQSQARPQPRQEPRPEPRQERRVEPRREPGAPHAREERGR